MSSKRSQIKHIIRSILMKMPFSSLWLALAKMVLNFFRIDNKIILEKGGEDKASSALAQMNSVEKRIYNTLVSIRGDVSK